MHMPRKASGDRWRATRPPAGRQPSRRRCIPRNRHLTTPRTPRAEISISIEIATETPRARIPCPARCAQQLLVMILPHNGAHAEMHPRLM